MGDLVDVVPDAPHFSKGTLKNLTINRVPSLCALSYKPKVKFGLIRVLFQAFFAQA